MPSSSGSRHIDIVNQWLEQTVIGLNFCPFAKKPFKKKAIRISVSKAISLEQLIDSVVQELVLLDQSDAQEIETSLIVVPYWLEKFDDYLGALNVVNKLIEEGGWQGVYQVASFHPQYLFEGEADDDQANYTNRAPFPLFHLIREHELSLALSNFPDPDQIVSRNKKMLRSLDMEELNERFPWSSSDYLK